MTWTEKPYRANDFRHHAEEEYEMSSFTYKKR